MAFTSAALKACHHTQRGLFPFPPFLQGIPRSNLFGSEKHVTRPASSHVPSPTYPSKTASFLSVLETPLRHPERPPNRASIAYSRFFRFFLHQLGSTVYTPPFLLPVHWNLYPSGFVVREIVACIAGRSLPIFFRYRLVAPIDHAYREMPRLH